MSRPGKPSLGLALKKSRGSNEAQSIIQAPQVSFSFILPPQEHLFAYHVETSLDMTGRFMSQGTSLDLGSSLPKHKDHHENRSGGHELMWLPLSSPLECRREL